MERYFEINRQRKTRAGEYKEPSEITEIIVVHWHVAEGEGLLKSRDPNTGTPIGKDVVTVTNPGSKEEITTFAEDWEVHATLKKILIAEGETVHVDLREHPAGESTLRLAILEVPDDVIVSQTTGQEPIGDPYDGSEPSVENSRLTLSPVAKRMVEAHSLSLDNLRSWLPTDVARIEREHVEAYLHSRTGETTGTERSVRAGPVVRRLAKQHDIDLSTIVGSGRGGIVTMRDIEYVGAEKATPAQSEAVEAETFIYRGIPAHAVVPSGRRIVIARNMVEAGGPLAGGAVDMDVEPLISYRNALRESFNERYGIDLRYDYFVAFACAALLREQEFLVLNSCWTERDGTPRIVFYGAVNIGFAVAMPAEKLRSGYSELAVPVVCDAEKKSFVELSLEADRIIAPALAGKPLPSSEDGVTFIVNNVGAPVRWRGQSFLGDEYPDPIPSPGTTAIVAFPAFCGDRGDRKVRLTVRFDHRVCDGHTVITFLRALQYLLEHPHEFLILV